MRIKADKINERIKDLIENFGDYVEYFKKNNPFSGPSEYFYGKIMTKVNNIDYDILFNEEFIELLYATLAAWGMHRMGPENKGPKISDFSTFKISI